MIDTTSGFSSASAFSKLSNFLAPFSASGKFALGDAALADAHHLEVGNARIGQRMAHAHVAEAHHQNPAVSSPPCRLSYPILNDIAGARRFFGRERRLKRRRRILRPADCRCVPFSAQLAK